MFFGCGCWREWSWVIIPDLKPGQVVWSDWCVTLAYWIWNGDDSTVTVWWHCDCFIGICMDCLNYLRLVYGGKELNSCAICWDNCLFKVFVRPALLRCPAVKLFAGWTKICQGFPEFASKICDNCTSFTDPDPNNGFRLIFKGLMHGSNKQESAHMEFSWTGKHHGREGYQSVKETTLLGSHFPRMFLASIQLQTDLLIHFIPQKNK